MIKNFEDIQKLSQYNLDATVRGFGEMNKGLQAIATELTDYSKRSVEDGTATLERLTGARSLEQAAEIQSEYVRKAYDDYVNQLSKVSQMYAGVARDAFRPFEDIMGDVR